MQQRGEIVKQAVYKSGYSISLLAKRMNKSRRWVYLLFDNPTVSLDVILQIGEIIHVDFSKLIQELKQNNSGLRTPELNTPETEKHTPEYWKNKYLNLLEKHIELLNKLP